MARRHIPTHCLRVVLLGEGTERLDLAASTDTGVERESLGAGRAARGTETSWQEAGLLQDISCPRDSATGALLFTAGALQLQEGKTQGRCKGLKKTEATVCF